MTYSYYSTDPFEEFAYPKLVHSVVKEHALKVMLCCRQCVVLVDTSVTRKTLLQAAFCYSPYIG